MFNGTPGPHSSVPSPKPTAQRMAPPVSTEKGASKLAPARSPKVGPSLQDFSSNQLPDRKDSEVIDLGAGTPGPKATPRKASKPAAFEPELAPSKPEPGERK
jgi:hypothetical protein